MSLSVLFLGPQSGTSLHRISAFGRMGHRVMCLDPRRLLPESAWIDRIEWHLSPTLLGHALLRRLDAELKDRRFDVAFVDGGSLLTAQALRRVRRCSARLVNFNHDNPYERRDWTRFSAFRRAAPEYDLMIVARPQNVAQAQRLGARRVMHHPFVADEVAHAPRPITPEIQAAWGSDVTFIGTWMPERGPFLMELVRRGIDLKIFGTGWAKAPEWPVLRSFHKADYLAGDNYAYGVQCARISLGLLSKGNGDLHTTRSMEIPSLGGLLCAERTAEHETFYRDGVEAVFWSDASECAELCRSLLSDEARRESIARNGRRRFLDNGYTSENLIRKTIGALE